MGLRAALLAALGRSAADRVLSARRLSPARAARGVALETRMTGRGLDAERASAVPGL